MGYIGGGIGKNEQGIVVPISLEIQTSRVSLGYNVVVASLTTPLFVVGGVNTEEKPTIDCVEQIDDMVAPNRPKPDNVVAYYIVVGVQGCSTLVCPLKHDLVPFAPT